jgi:hypothetical protein
LRPPLVVPLAIGGLAAFAATRFAVSDSDLFWHLGVGRDIATKGIPAVDSYSWTVAGRPVLSDQWLGELALYAAYALAAWRGIELVRALAVGAIAALIVWTALAERPRRPLVAVLAAAPAIALSRFAWTDRPELLGLLCFTVLIALLHAGRRGDRVAFAWCAPLLLVWANLHGSYALGLGLVAAVGIERAVVDRGGRRRYAALVAACALATFVTPAGIATWTSSGGHFLAPPRFVQEEGTPDVTTLPGALFSLALLATLAVALLAPSSGRRDTLFALATLVPVLFVSLTATRHLVFFPIAAAAFLASLGPDAASALWAQVRGAWPQLRSMTPEVRVPGEGTREHGRSPGRRVGEVVAAEIAAVMFAVALLIAGVTTAPAEPDLSAFPTTALQQLPAGPGTLNRYDWGGYLIWYAPATPVFVDGRLFPYVGEALDDYRAVIGLHADWRQVLARRGIRTLLVAPSDAVAVEAQDLGWPVLMKTSSVVLLRVP